MRNSYRTAPAVAALILSAATAGAQELPDIGFESVGRAWPLAADIYDTEVVGAVRALFGPPYPGRI